MDAKQRNKMLRELAMEALARELHKEQGLLFAEFERAADGKGDPFDLDERIRCYVTGPSKRLWGLFQARLWGSIVSQGIVNGFLDEKEVPGDVLDVIRNEVAMLRDLRKTREAKAGKKVVRLVPRDEGPKPGSSRVYQIKITLQDIQPPIWRRILLDPGMTLNKLHLAIQAAMGWTQTHLYEFDHAGKRIGVPDPEYGDEIVNAKRVKVDEVLVNAGDRVSYMYDMGDGWEHDIFLEKVGTSERGFKRPVCLEGSRACPPEDCGGAGGYEELCEALKDAKHPRHEEFRKWLDRDYDPEAFSVEDANDALKHGMSDLSGR